MKNGAKLIISIVLCQVAGIVGSLFTRQSVDTWYININKPFFNPPDSVFAPVWIILYLLMGVSLFIFWRKGQNTRQSKIAISAFMLQLILNVLWSFAFFGCRSPLAGLIVIVLLWVAILLTIVSFLKISRIASILLSPYLLWVSFAAVLNAAIFVLNR
ncbi:MAG: tryptophan-rich sensory protein [Candidatus Omnitrophica bacterium]|nr:tryptophan-rich sensory protein [Candidatus Omnitrophota bacterium]MBU1127743.1 tryptophan-rich sensory protein [Candidatus Omnitrophota bacterium]MBU1783714.1 tryptophan-rich sensory protein [Candidatus Omnitrophota bacterium]MBU1851767.1 tryptophan-rich sensory protein [Candidatus Omnitrophota bacterium]